MSKKVSIVMPTFNGDRFIQESINSCLDQTYENLELIIVEDGSDCLKDILRSYDDPRIKYLRHGENKGISFSLNAGFASSIGDYLTWTSDDNIYEKNAIEKMVKVLEADTRIDFVYSNFREMDENGGLIRSVEMRQPKTLDHENYIGACFLYKRKVYDKIGGYAPDLFLVEDYDYWLRVYYSGFYMKKINEYLYKVRMHDNCLTCKYDSDQIEKLAQKTRDKYISEGKKAFQHGRICFYEGDLARSKKLINKGLKHNPFNIVAWRFWFLLNLSPGMVEKVRSMKRKIFK